METRQLTLPTCGGYGVATVTLPGPWETLAAFKVANAKAGKFYFSRGAMRAFLSRPLRTIYHGRFFIDSIQCEHSDGTLDPRIFKLRLMRDSGETASVAIPPRVDTWDGKCKDPASPGQWNENFGSASEARDALRGLLARDASRAETIGFLVLFSAAIGSARCALPGDASPTVIARALDITEARAVELRRMWRAMGATWSG